MTLMFADARKVNHETGDPIKKFSDGDELVINRAIIRPWSGLDDLRFPRAWSTLEDTETLIVNVRTHEVYVVREAELQEAGVAVLAFG